MSDDFLVASIIIKEEDRKYLGDAYGSLVDKLTRSAIKGIDPRVADDNLSLLVYAKGPFDANRMKGLLIDFEISLPQHKRMKPRLEMYVEPTGVEKDLQARLNSLQGEKNELERRLTKWKAGTSLESMAGSGNAPITELSRYDEFSNARTKEAEKTYTKLDEILRSELTPSEDVYGQLVIKYLIESKSEQRLQAAFDKKTKDKFGNLEKVAEEAKAVEDNIGSLSKSTALSSATKTRMKEDLLKVLNELKEKPQLYKKELGEFIKGQQEVLRELQDMFVVPLYARLHEQSSGYLFEFYIPKTTDSKLAEELDFEHVFSNSFVNKLQSGEYETPIDETLGIEFFRAYIKRDDLGKRDIWDMKDLFERALLTARKNVLQSTGKAVKIIYEQKMVGDIFYQPEPDKTEKRSSGERKPASDGDGRLGPRGDSQKIQTAILDFIEKSNVEDSSRANVIEHLKKNGMDLSPENVTYHLRQMIEQGLILSQGNTAATRYTMKGESAS